MQPVWRHTWFPFEQVLSLDGCDLGDGGEHVGTARCRSLHTVAVVDLSVTRLLVYIKLG